MKTEIRLLKREKTSGVGRAELFGMYVNDTEIFYLESRIVGGSVQKKAYTVSDTAYRAFDRIVAKIRQAEKEAEKKRAAGYIIMYGSDDDLI